MASPWFDPLLFATTCLGGGGVLLSLWLGFSSERGTRTSLQLLLGLVALSVGAFAVVAAIAGQPMALWGSAGTLLALYLLLVITPSPGCVAVAGRIAQLARCRPGRRAAMVALWAFCPFCALTLVYGPLDHVDEITDDHAFARSQAAIAVPAPTPDADSWLTTDLGRTIRTMHLDGVPSAPTPAMLEARDRLLKQWDLDDTVIQLPLGWENTNCHGFIFAAGRHWIGGSEVDRILQDNGYRPVRPVRADDLAIYRDQDGKVIHSGIVRGLASEGVILVESKWGQSGRFIHRHDRHPYGGAEYVFYRSARTGHLLRGVYPTPLDESGGGHIAPPGTSALPPSGTVVGL